ncbi:MAG TPA: DUF2892 domain-containing protein [Bacillota bacterium]|nr:DUF2892 domain-containing protein [Bacillota bacterium]
MVAQNVGPLDRTTRVILGLVVILYRYIGSFSGIGWDLAAIGGALLIWEGLLGYCLLYGILGIKTRGR